MRLYIYQFINLQFMLTTMIQRLAQTLFPDGMEPGRIIFNWNWIITYCNSILMKFYNYLSELLTEFSEPG